MSDETYQTALMDSGSLQSHGDAVEEDESKNHVVKELMSDDSLTHQTKPADKQRERGLTPKPRTADYQK